MMTKKLEIAVLISGRGSNLMALIKAAQDPLFPVHIALVISNKKNAAGNELALAARIPLHIIDHKDYTDREHFDNAMSQLLISNDIELVCLAGFMRILSKKFVDHWRGRLINIHPSLLPAYKGLDVHQRMIDDGIKTTGCTVHYVTPDMDEGPVIGQRSVPVFPRDTPQTLAARILIEEHILYPECIKKIATGKADSTTLFALYHASKKT